MTYEDFSKMKSLFMEVIEANDFIGDIVKGDCEIPGPVLGVRYENLYGVFGNPAYPLSCRFGIDLTDRSKEPEIEYIGSGKIDPIFFDRMRECVMKILDIYNKWGNE